MAQVKIKGICLLCLSPSGEEHLVINDNLNSNTTLVLSFLFILRYLEIDISILKTDNKLTEKILLCEECGSRMDQFAEWYRNFELIRLFLTNSVENFQNVIKQSDPSSSGFCTVGSSGMGELKKEILAKCHQQLISMPKVTLIRLRNAKSVDNPDNDNSHQDSPINSNSNVQNETIQSEITPIKLEPDDNRLTESQMLSCTSIKGFPSIKNEPQDIAGGEDDIFIKTEFSKCLLCFNPCECEQNNLDGNENSSFRSFKLIMQYFGIDITTLLNNCGLKYEMEFVLCDKCDLVTNQFVRRYQDFEIGRLFMINFIHNLVGVIRQSEENFRDFLPDETLLVALEALSSSVAHLLRKELLKKCLEKVTSIPRVKCYHLRHNKKFPENSVQDGNNGLDGGQNCKDNLKLRHHKNSKCIKKTNPTPSRRPKYEPRLKCNFCSKKFIGNSFVKFHMMSHHSYQFVLHKLPKQTSQTEFEQSLEKLASKGKKYGNRKIGCPYCIESKRDDIIRSHILYIHFDKILLALNPAKINEAEATQTMHNVKESETPLKCIKCGKTFSCELTLNRHLQHHSSQFSCSFCDRKCSFPFQLKEHEISAHPMAKLKTELPRDFTETKFEFVLSRMIKETISSSGNNLWCNICSKQFLSNRAYLRNHVLTQHLARVIENCKSFDFSFLENGSEANHTFEYLEEKKKVGKDKLDRVLSDMISKTKLSGHVKCVTCKKSYVEMLDLRFHIITVHNTIITAKLNVMS